MIRKVIFALMSPLFFAALVVWALFAVTHQKPEPNCQAVCGRYINMRADGACFCLVDPNQMLYQRREP